jgi:hypothetical protein
VKRISDITHETTAPDPEGYIGIDSDLTRKTKLKYAAKAGIAAIVEENVFATAGQGARADTAVQPADLAPIATSGSYGDLVGTPVLGSAAVEDAGSFAPAAAALPMGGAIGQFLRKAGAPNFQVSWEDLPGGGDMLKSVFDPTNKAANAFDSANHDFDPVGTMLAETSVQAAIAALASLLEEGVKIRQIALKTSATSGTTSSNTAYGGTLGSGQALTPVSATSVLLVLGYAFMTLSRSTSGLFGSVRISKYNGSAWVAPAIGIPSTGGTANGAPSVDERHPAPCLSILTQADKDGSVWRVVYAGNVSTTGGTPVLGLQAINYLMIEIEGLSIG